MKTLLIIYGIIFIMDWLVFFTAVFDVRKECKKLGLKYPTTLFLSAFWGSVRLGILFLIPIYNIVILITSIYSFDEIEEETISKIKSRQNLNK